MGQNMIIFSISTDAAAIPLNLSSCAYALSTV